MLYFAQIMLTARKIRFMLAFAIVVAIAVIASVAMKSLPFREPPSTAVNAADESRADVTLRGIRVSETSNGTSRWTLVAEKAEYETGRSEVKLAGARLTVAPINDSLGELLLTAPTAFYNTDTKDIALGGGVHAKSSKGMEFTAMSVRFSGARGVLTTGDAVRVSDERLTLEGVGMAYNVASSAFKISRNVTATMRGGKRH
jgi:LPS export ABC transporter protein LptC